MRIFLAEKGIDVPMIDLDLAADATHTPEFLIKNPYGAVPVLEFDDGACLAESIAICRYFDETHADPPLFGRDPRERAFVEMWNLRMELYLMRAVEECFRHTHDYFKGRIEQIPAFGDQCRADIHTEYARLDSRLAESEYIAGDTLTIADISALVAIDFARVVKVRIGAAHTHLARWHAAMTARASAGA